MENVTEEVNGMQSFCGKSVYKGIVLGPVVVLKNHNLQVKRKKNRGCRG